MAIPCFVRTAICGSDKRGQHKGEKTTWDYACVSFHVAGHFAYAVRKKKSISWGKLSFGQAFEGKALSDETLRYKI